MATVVIMPKQGLMMEEGTLTQWLKKEGETVTAGEPLFEMETDKLTITMDAEASGTLLKIIHPEGDVVPITQAARPLPLSKPRKRFLPPPQRLPPQFRP